MRNSGTPSTARPILDRTSAPCWRYELEVRPACRVEARRYRAARQRRGRRRRVRELDFEGAWCLSLDDAAGEPIGRALPGVRRSQFPRVKETPPEVAGQRSQTRSEQATSTGG